MVATLEHIFREEWGRVLATLIGFLGDFHLAEEAAQEAFTIAAERWPRDGVPSNPRAWLMTTARNRATDAIRRERTLAAKASLLAAADDGGTEIDTAAFPDERLALIFTCCHPALAVEAQVALTLRTLGGLTTEEIARAFLVPEQTMAKRLVRAKQKIKAARIPFRVPPRHLLVERLAVVLAVVWLIFNEGYGGRDELAADAIWLGRALAGLLPDEPEVHGLLGMMLIHDSRREARFKDGEIVLLGDQDRSCWNAGQIAEGRGALNHALAGSRTTTGRPLLANDPHLSGQTPSFWYLAQLAWGGQRVIGATVPGVPSVLIGHNNTIAWGVSTINVDGQDLYVEQVNAQNEALFQGAWEPLTVVTETITVRDAPAVTLAVRSSRHGPLISDVVSPGGPTLALRWSGNDPQDDGILSALAINRAHDWQHVGGQHAPDSISVGVPEAGVLFLGDCYYPPPVHLRTPESALDVAMLASLVSERYAWYVEGHNAPHSRAALRAALAQLDGGADD